MKKKINFKNISKENDSLIKSSIDEWVKGRDITQNEDDNPVKQEEEKKQEKEKCRLSIDLPVYLHKRIKKVCVIEGTTIKDKLIKILEEMFPEK